MSSFKLPPGSADPQTPNSSSSPAVLGPAHCTLMVSQETAPLVGQEKKGTSEDKIVGWHHRLNGHEFAQTPGGGEGQGSLACCSPWGCRVLDRLSDLTATMFFFFSILHLEAVWMIALKLVAVKLFIFVDKGLPWDWKDFLVWVCVAESCGMCVYARAKP